MWALVCPSLVVVLLKWNEAKACDFVNFLVVVVSHNLTPLTWFTMPSVWRKSKVTASFCCLQMRWGDRCHGRIGVPIQITLVPGGAALPNRQNNMSHSAARRLCDRSIYSPTQGMSWSFWYAQFCYFSYPSFTSPPFFFRVFRVPTNQPTGVMVGVSWRDRVVVILTFNCYIVLQTC